MDPNSDIENTKKVDASYLIQKFSLLPHPEGGFFRESFRSTSNVTTVSRSISNELLEPNKSASTAIYFLVVPGNVSRLHKIVSDEVWHFYLDGSLNIIELCDDNDSMFKLTRLGSDIVAGEIPQYVVKGDTWFGCYPDDDVEYSFVGCTVAPGFEFVDFELGSREKLLIEFPGASEVINKLTEGLP